jgi:nitrite reductase (NO-forming)
MRAERGRARRHPLVAGFVVAYLAAGGMTVALGDRATSGSWLAVHLVLFGAATNAIVVWSEHFAAVLLRAAPVSERTATARALALNLGAVAVLGGVHTGRPMLTVAGAWLVGAVVPAAHGGVLDARRRSGAGWPSQSSSIWLNWPAAHRSSISTSGSIGWFRPSWLALPCRC